MTTAAAYATAQPARTEIDQLPDPVLIEFGTDWCPICQAAQPLIASALAAVPTLQHLKVEDGPGRPLGRSLRIKLWPTLVLLRQGVELGRVVRPTSRAAIDELLALSPAPGPQRG